MWLILLIFKRIWQNQSGLTNYNQNWEDEVEHYSNIFKSQEEINAEIKEIKEQRCFIWWWTLSFLPTNPAQINDRSEMLKKSPSVEQCKVCITSSDYLEILSC
jgi:hypothetical protein